MSKRHNTLESFSHAYDGIKTAIKNEPNFRVHLIISICVLLASVYFGISALEWVIILFTLSFVIILELINTSLEAIVDLVQPSLHPKAKIAKDVAAASVLLSSIVAIAIGSIIFVPRIVGLF